MNLFSKRHNTLLFLDYLQLFLLVQTIVLLILSALIKFR